ncbi:hypothetical protein NQZ68_015570 [Dissostichus eleginoides]|nr:hypothetical protein NQZ68_015570 [Dissostichus eleginoides]
MVKLYRQRLQQLGVEEPEVNSSRLKDKLLAEIPELEAHQQGRDVLLAFQNDVGIALSQASDYSDAIILAEIWCIKDRLRIAQLLQYNCYARYKEAASTHRHSKDHKTPFPVYMGISVYAKTRKRKLIELLHGHGISISYDRVLEISAQLGEATVRKYVEDGVVCSAAPLLKYERRC